MKRGLFFSILIIIFLSGYSPRGEDNGREIQYTTQDGIVITGNLFIIDKNGPTILLFHQGGSNGRAEYGPIIPRLLDLQYNVLSIDQRVGGQVYGSYNRTIATIPKNDYGYCDVLPDLIGAWDFLEEEQFSGPRILWGSSYSAALIIQLASHENFSIDRALAFSPASNPKAMNGCHPNQYLP